MGNATSAAPTTAASHDDALAQIAVEDIDRLLSGADITIPDRSEPAPVAAPVAAPVVAAPVPPTAMRPVPAKEPEKALAASNDAMAELDSLPSQPDAAPDAPSKYAPAAAADEAMRMAAASVDQLLAAGDETDDVPFYLLPLVWLNAPFAGLSDWARNALGMVGMLTVLHAMGVLIYVYKFRHHH